MRLSGLNNGNRRYILFYVCIVRKTSLSGAGFMGGVKYQPFQKQEMGTKKGSVCFSYCLGSSSLKLELLLQQKIA